SGLAELLDALAGVPRLPGALCRDRAALFDPPASSADDDDVEYAQGAALALCRRCPSLAGCRVWFDNLPARHRPLGVIAGQINQPRPKGRPPNPKGQTESE
ncbi:MAG: hypothetical protein JWR37_1042, partial [Mycobacterium sp.]|nr:hypothetical protein [Mycobacterium sp.]